MKKKNVVLTLGALSLAVMAAPAMAASGQDNVGCGWGSMVFAGKSGVANQVLAATTNGTSGNQTFGISSGTAGCTQDGVVPSYAQLSMFTGENMDRLASDMSAGHGEALATLADLWGINNQDKQAFYQAAHQHFDQIYSSPNVTSDQVVAHLRSVLASDKTLAKYAV